MGVLVPEIGSELIKVDSVQTSVDPVGYDAFKGMETGTYSIGMSLGEGLQFTKSNQGDCWESDMDEHSGSSDPMEVR